MTNQKVGLTDSDVWSPESKSAPASLSSRELYILVIYMKPSIKARQPGSTARSRALHLMGPGLGRIQQFHTASHCECYLPIVACFVIREYLVREIRHWRWSSQPLALARLFPSHSFDYGRPSGLLQRTTKEIINQLVSKPLSVIYSLARTVTGVLREIHVLVLLPVGLIPPRMPRSIPLPLGYVSPFQVLIIHNNHKFSSHMSSVSYNDNKYAPLTLHANISNLVVCVIGTFKLALELSAVYAFYFEACIGIY